MDKVVLGIILGPVAVNGQFKCKIFSYPPNWQTAFITNKTSSSQQVHEKHEIKLLKYPYNSKKDLCICASSLINNRLDVNGIVGYEIWTDRNLLPNNTDDIYCHDMVDLSIYYENRLIGKFLRIHDFGAGLILETDKNLFIHWNHVERVDLNSGIYIKNSVLDE